MVASSKIAEASTTISVSRGAAPTVSATGCGSTAIGSGAGAIRVIAFAAGLFGFAEARPAGRRALVRLAAASVCPGR